MKLDIGAITLLACVGLGFLVLSRTSPSAHVSRHKPNYHYTQEREAVVPILFEERYAAKGYDRKI